MPFQIIRLPSIKNLDSPCPQPRRSNWAVLFISHRYTFTPFILLESVREACGKGLLQTWLGQYGGNILEVLEKLDVEESHEIVAKALTELYKHCEPARLVKDFDILDEK